MEKELRNFYNSKRWKDLARLKKMMNPTCERCQEEGRITPAENIHHIKHIKITDIDRYHWLDINNLLSVCIRCHNDLHDRGNKSLDSKYYFDEFGQLQVK